MIIIKNSINLDIRVNFYQNYLFKKIKNFKLKDD